jgi:hypothetical protein
MSHELGMAGRKRNMGNDTYIARNKTRFKQRHYLLNPRTGTRFFDLHSKTLGEKRNQYGGDFCIIINCSDTSDSAYILPVAEFSDFFSDEYLMGANKSDKNRYRWRCNILSDELRLKTPDTDAKTRVISNFYNAFELLQGAPEPRPKKTVYE